MRGKKDAFENYVDYYIDPDMDFDKRAPMGFQEMRGKKDTDKRAPMGFQGMRGKRNVGQRFETGMDFGSPRSLNGYQGTINVDSIQSIIIRKERNIWIYMAINIYY